ESRGARFSSILGAKRSDSMLDSLCRTGQHSRRGPEFVCGSEFAVLRSKRAAFPTGDRPEESVSEEYVAYQKAHFAATEDERFLWQTTHPLVRGRELAVLESVLEGQPDTVLEVGCGEGANIETLKAHARGVRFTGVDYSRERVAFCR